MIQNLNIRWIIIISIIITGIYFIMPSYELYTIKNDPELHDIDTSYLTEDAIQLGLDLKGGLYIILELDYKASLLQNSNPKLSFDKREKLLELISLSIQNAINTILFQPYTFTSTKK